MRVCWTQKELVEFLEGNPTGIKVFFNKKSIPDLTEYIFLDNIQDIPIPADDMADYSNAAQITLYAKDIDRFNQCKKWIREHFVSSPRCYAEDDFNKAVFDLSLFVEEW